MLALTFQVHAVAVGEIEDIVADLTAYWYAVAIGLDVSNVHTACRETRDKKDKKKCKQQCDQKVENDMVLGWSEGRQGLAGGAR